MAELAWRLAVNLAWIIVLVTFTVLVLVNPKPTVTYPVDEPIYPTVELPCEEPSVPCQFEGWPMTSMLEFLTIRDSVRIAMDKNVTTQYPIDDERRLIVAEGEMWYTVRVDPGTYAIVLEKFNYMTIHGVHGA